MRANGTPGSILVPPPAFLCLSLAHALELASAFLGLAHTLKFASALLRLAQTLKSALVFLVILVGQPGPPFATDLSLVKGILARRISTRSLTTSRLLSVKRPRPARSSPAPEA